METASRRTLEETRFRERIGLLTEAGKARLLDYELHELARTNPAGFELAMLEATEAFQRKVQVGKAPSLWETVSEATSKVRALPDDQQKIRYRAYSGDDGHLWAGVWHAPWCHDNHGWFPCPTGR
jgi:hypothetical protein